jgi:hypothetical protein
VRSEKQGAEGAEGAEGVEEARRFFNLKFKIATWIL